METSRGGWVTEALQQSHWASKGDCKLKKTRYPKLRNSVLFYGEVQESGLTEIIPLIYISALWGQYPVFPHPEFPGGSPWGVAAVWKLQDGRSSPMAAGRQVFAPSRAPSRAHKLAIDSGCNCWTLWCPSYTDMEERFHFLCTTWCFDLLNEMIAMVKLIISTLCIINCHQHAVF